MVTIISPLFTFPPISWWAAVIDAERVILDIEESYKKMSYRNKYTISGANNMIQLTVPLTKGREQRTIMSDVMIWNEDIWQVKHWRTLISVYRRTPYFCHYEDTLRPLFENRYDHLIDFNVAALNWVSNQLRIDIDIQTGNPTDDDGNYLDLRKMSFKRNEATLAGFPRYYQIFEDRFGFIPNMSILDLLFSEGTYTSEWLRSHQSKILMPY